MNCGAVPNFAYIYVLITFKLIAWTIIDTRRRGRVFVDYVFIGPYSWM